MGSFCKPTLILFCVQVALIFVVVCASIINLTFEYGNKDLWIMVLTASLGYIMPNPKLKINNTLETPNTIKVSEVRQSI